MAEAGSSTHDHHPHHSHFDELRWVIQIRSSLEQQLEEEEEEDGDGIPVSVFNVPKLLQLNKPEAYLPQLIAFGPYHHWRSELYEMEGYKLAAAKRAEKRSRGGLKLQDLVGKLLKLEHKIRAHYHRYLDFGGETLAWMMVVDAAFLLEFLQSYHYNADSSKGDNVITNYQEKNISPRMLHLFDYSRKKSAHNVIIQDTLMLENQIPLFLIQKVLELQCQTTEAANEMLCKMLLGFLKEVCPFKMKDNFPVDIDVAQHAHLLELLYCILVPRFGEDDGDIVEDIEGPADHDEASDGKGTTKLQAAAASAGPVKQLCSTIWDLVYGLSAGPLIAYIRAAIVSRPAQLMVKLPWKMVTSVPGFTILVRQFQKFCSLPYRGGGGEDGPRSSSSTVNNIDKAPKVEEIMIPSVSELTELGGIRFSPTNGDLTTAMFDAKTATFYLPTVTLDVNSEVILRNLVAYEASAAPGSLIFARYTELMNGIIDTEEDVKILRENGLIKNRMKSDGQVANMWNGMIKSVRLTRVPFLDKLIEDVNKYHSSRWRVKAKRFMNKYVFASWQLLTFIAATLLLLLSATQAFCSIYTCTRFFGAIIVVKQ